MKRRTGWVVVVAAVVMGAAVTVPGPVALAAPAADGSDYAFDPDARDVPAADGTGGAVRLDAGRVYRSALVGRGKAYYRLALDAAVTAYVSVTAVPDPEDTLASGDGIRVAVQNADGVNCSYDSSTVGASRDRRPVTAWGAREILVGKGLCQEAGTYYLVVERAETDTATERPWELELAPVAEAAVRRGGPTDGPGAWDSAPPAPPSGEPADGDGGGGFTRASRLRPGVWRDEIAPGQSLFYKVPVGWGQQVHATAELGSAAGAGTGFVVPALDLALHNPVRAEVVNASVGYDGGQKTAALPVLPPVGYANRYAPTDPARSLRFAGDHYLVVHLSARVADRFGDGPYDLVLRITVDGTTQDGPRYTGPSVPGGLFGPGSDGLPGSDAVAAGPTGNGDGTAGSSGDRGAMTAVAAGGIGTGTALLLVLGGWTAVARRRAGAQIRARAQNPTA
ncbi:hypothetical protein ACIPPJ_15650 [Streptomyces sp. NPDC086091]|uniref:hypothetical protein n=1 Tax=Streptomyces sp. NPDC086091 TaxID=3365751 RepID=UPI003821D771